MQLRSMLYIENEGTPRVWRTEPLTFGAVNLLVGKNATGKTRIISAIIQAADILTRGLSTAQGSSFWKLELQNARPIHAEIRCENDTILLADATRELLRPWAQSVQWFAFSSALVLNHGRNAPIRRFLEFFDAGVKKRGESFQSQLLSDMNSLGHSLESISRENNRAGESWLEIKETRNRTSIPHHAVSQGMLRCLALVIFIDFIEATGGPACVLIDDLGEGLDFQHSGSVIDWLLHKQRQIGMQLIFSTNDRTIMNKVPLENWTILQQHDETTRVFNYVNSRQRFDNFKFTGLSNFDFFSMDFTSNAEE